MHWCYDTNVKETECVPSELCSVCLGGVYMESRNVYAFTRDVLKTRVKGGRPLVLYFSHTVSNKTRSQKREREMKRSHKRVSPSPCSISVIYFHSLHFLPTLILISLSFCLSAHFNFTFSEEGKRRTQSSSFKMH